MPELNGNTKTWVIVKNELAVHHLSPKCPIFKENSKGNVKIYNSLVKNANPEYICVLCLKKAEIKTKCKF